jgi:hypothetical protein
MKKSLSHCLRAGALVAAVALIAGSPATADPVVCSHYKPGMLAFLTGATATRCVAYQGDTMVNPGPVYSGPAVIAPQPTYAPTPMAAEYPYVRGQSQAEPAPAAEAGPVRTRMVRRATVKRVVKRTVVKRQVVNVKNNPPPRKGGPQIVHARAEVRIYGPQRMDIRLYRR